MGQPGHNRRLPQPGHLLEMSCWVITTTTT